MQQQQQLCSSRSALHLPAQTHLTCRMQHRQPPTASLIHWLIKRTISAQSFPVTPGPSPCSHPSTQRGTKAFHSFYPQKHAGSEGEQRIIIPPFNSTALKATKLNFFLSLHLYDEEVLVREALWENKAVLKAYDGDDKTVRKQNLEEAERSTFERADLMLDGPSRIHAPSLPSGDCLRLQTVESELCKVSSAPKHHAGGWKCFC